MVIIPVFMLYITRLCFMNMIDFHKEELFLSDTDHSHELGMNLT